MAEVVAVPQGLGARAARGRVDAALSNPDPCTVETIAGADLARASGAQLAAIANKKDVECPEKRKEDDKRKHEEQCDAAAAAVEAGGATADQDVVLGAEADLAKRIAAKSISSIRSTGRGQGQGAVLRHSSGGSILGRLRAGGRGVDATPGPRSTVPRESTPICATS